MTGCDVVEAEQEHLGKGLLPNISLTHGTIPVYRLNTYPLIHLGFLHALLNTLVMTPLLERFEADHGTLLTAAMFVGRMF